MSTATDETGAETVAGAMERREVTAPPGGGLMTVTGDQTWWNKQQLAGLSQLGIAKAPAGDLAVFLHYAQKTGLDPFARQVHMIERREKQGDNWVSKWTIQVGIDGFRVVRDRAARRDHHTVEFEDTIWFDAKGGEHKVWLDDETPPAACRVVLLKDGFRFPAVLRMKAYMPVKNGNPTGRWRMDSDHQLEKCCEAFATRRAFPQDLGGIYIEEEMESGIEQPPSLAARPERARRERPMSPQTVSGKVVQPEQPGRPTAESGSAPAGEPAFNRDKAVKRLQAMFTGAGIGKDDRELRLKLTGAFASGEGEGPLWVESTNELDDNQLGQAIAVLDRVLKQCKEEDTDPESRLRGIGEALDTEPMPSADDPGEDDR
jgi:phage recombination protein Bet